MIKQTVQTVIFALSSSAIFAQGIEFIEEDWNKALQKAKMENKLIFLDGYTTWCGPCKMLSSKIFPQEKVGSFFNANFVNAKVDMEKGQGIELAKKYNVRAYPTMLFIDDSGEVVHTIVGVVGANELIAAGQAALNPLSNNKGIKEQYLANPEDDKITRKYLRTLIDSYDPEIVEVGLKYLSRQENWFEMNNEEIIVELIQVENQTARSYILAKWSEYLANKQHFSQEFQNDFPVNIASYELFFNGEKYKSIEQFNQLAILVAGSKETKTYDALYALYLSENDKTDELVSQYKKMLKKYKDVDDQIQIAHNLGEKGNSAKAYKLGLKAIKKVLKKDEKNFGARNAKAILLYYSGKQEEANKLFSELQKELN